MDRSGQCPFVMDPDGSDIHGEIARLRDRGPVTQVELPGGVVVWSVTDDALIRALLLDPRVSKDAYRHWPDWNDGTVPADWPLAIWVSVRNMVTAHGEDHTRMRRPVASAFTRRRIAALRPRIQRTADDLLDAMAAEPPGRPLDLRERFAHPLPHLVMCDLFGIPEEYRAGLHRIIKGFFRTSASAEEARANAEALHTTIADFLAHKRGNPGDDLTCDLIAVRDENGAALTEEELADNLILLYTAGYETTVNLLDHAAHALLRDPEQRELVRRGEAGWDDVTEEALRHEPPGAHAILRYAVEDIDTGGTVIRRGDPIMISYAAAGRDPARHGESADRFDVTRPTRREHLSFGHGAHHCLGAPLARLEASIALGSLFARFPRLALADPDRPPAPQRSFISNGHRELMVVLDHEAVED
ncbi:MULTISPECIES: cytochrome P450 family protein [unclassified Streptomyces]|uniref:cytochrome P450 family protein n=1 Tax=unclassified Streptomyces TaxID=2593676 RepID=UPI00136A89DA|nr:MULTISPECIES: cytochrome P450 [unclassified Streptomyces]MCW5254556.1 cytochrome P450 [Streptomyces sp. SHP 1-2]MYU25762.1 cytochrome P450 [Streptomyces sp. SID8352]